LIISTATPGATDEASDISLSSERSLHHRHIHSVEVTTTGEENEQALAAIGDQFQVENSIDTDPIRALQSQFWDCQVEWPEGGNQYFIPADDLRRLVTVDSIRNQLKYSKPDLLEDRLLEMAESACKSAFKLYAILVCANRVSHFYNFLQEGLSDDDLPFIRLSGSKKSFELHSSRRPNKPIMSLRSWPLFQVKHFSRDQYQMLAPIFKKSHLVEHYDLLDNQVLPFIEDQVRDLAKSGGVGGFGSVWAVRMHPAHQFLHRDTNPGVGTKGNNQKNQY
jgi:hypothetical protein